LPRLNQLGDCPLQRGKAFLDAHLRHRIVPSEDSSRGHTCFPQRSPCVSIDPRGRPGGHAQVSVERDTPSRVPRRPAEPRRRARGSQAPEAIDELLPWNLTRERRAALSAAGNEPVRSPTTQRETDQPDTS
jgi:hypothetical protein